MKLINADKFKEILIEGSEKFYEPNLNDQCNDIIRATLKFIAEEIDKLPSIEIAEKGGNDIL